MALILGEQDQIQDFLNRELQKHFNPQEVKISERVRVVSDLYKFKPETEYLHAQMMGKIPMHYSLYFDGEYVCGFDSTNRPEEIMYLFWKGIVPLYEKRTIYFNKSFYQAEAEIEKHEVKRKKQAKIDKINSMDVPYEVKDVLKELENDETKKGEIK